MTTAGAPAGTSLPVKGGFGLSHTASLVMVVLVAAVSASALIYPSRIYPAHELFTAFLANDVVNLLVGLPALAVSIGLTRRGSLIGLLFWPGALLYLLYNYLPPLLCLPLNPAFLLELAIVTLSLYTLVAVAAQTDFEAVKARLTGAVAERTGGAVLAALGLLTLLRALIELIRAMILPIATSRAAIALDAVDTLFGPAFLLGGILLWRRHAFGYVAGLALLFLASMLFVGLIAYMAVQRLIGTGSAGLGDVLAVLVMGTAVFIPFWLFLRGVARSRS